MRYQVLSATFLALVFVRVECFVPGSRSLEATVVRSISDVKTSWAFKRSRSTILHYRNAPHDNQVDFYNILGIPRTANDAEIKRAYRTKAKRFHPDANPDMDTTEMFQQLNRAYEVLKDRDLRLQFDRFGSDGIGNSYASDSSVRSQSIRKPDEVYYQSESNPFETEMNQPYTGRPATGRNPFEPAVPPYIRTAPGVYYHPPPTTPHRSPREPYAETPLNQRWDPWRSPFDDMHNEHMANRVHDTEFQSSSFKGRDNRHGFRNVNTSHQRVHKDVYQSNGTTRRGRTNENINTGHSQVHIPNVEDAPRGARRTDGPSQQFMGSFVDFDTHPSQRNFRAGTRRRWLGDDLCIELEIDYETAIRGGEEKIRIKRLETCTTCGGDGIHPGAEVKTCEHCGGSGALLHKSPPVGMGPTDNFSGHTVCPHCRGTGQTVAENCGDCHGKGIRPTSKDMTVMIPPGVTDGSKLRLKGEGDAGPMGGPSGDLFIFLKIRSMGSYETHRP